MTVISVSRPPGLGSMPPAINGRTTSSGMYFAKAESPPAMRFSASEKSLSSARYVGTCLTSASEKRSICSNCPASRRIGRANNKLANSTAVAAASSASAPTTKRTRRVLRSISAAKAERGMAVNSRHCSNGSADDET